MDVQTKTNGFITEDGLVAFYRDFGRLGEDIEASGVSETLSEYSRSTRNEISKPVKSKTSSGEAKQLRGKLA